jgi:ribosome-associated protein
MDKEKIIQEELSFQYSKSPWHGGQNVNKRNTKVQVFFTFKESKYLSDWEKNRLYEQYPEWVISLDAHEERSQLQNKQNTIKKLIEILKKTLESQKKG